MRAATACSLAVPCAAACGGEDRAPDPSSAPEQILVESELSDPRG